MTLSISSVNRHRDGLRNFQMAYCDREPACTKLRRICDKVSYDLLCRIREGSSLLPQVRIGAANPGTMMSRQQHLPTKHTVKAERLARPIQVCSGCH